MNEYRSRHKQRIILHSDMNCFYASVECLYRPEIRPYPVVVGGDELSRHGIVLAKNQHAKRFGIVTGESLMEARQKCPDCIVVPPNYELYLKFSRLAREIYNNYTDLVEPFGLDEAWLDVTDSAHLWGNEPLLIAQEISERIKAELGVTVSIGLSWNKIFAKFGSDYQKPDALTVITPDNYQDIVWNAPVRSLLYVGSATERKLHLMGIKTIGELACYDEQALQMKFGKIGPLLKAFARGEDTSPVKPFVPEISNVLRAVKSVGNGLTAPHDLCCEHEAKALIYLLAESVAQRLRELKLVCRTVAIHVRDADLASYTRQMTLETPTNLTSTLARAAAQLLSAHEPLTHDHPIRSLGVRACNLESEQRIVQYDLFGEAERTYHLECLDHTIDELRKRFGNTIIRRGIELADESLTDVDIKRDNIIHPVGYFS